MNRSITRRAGRDGAARARRVGCVFAAMAFALAPLAAGAHAQLERRYPEEGALADRNRVQAWFTQELESRRSTIQVFDAGGRQVDNGDGGVDLLDPEHKSMLVTVPEKLPGAVYTVRWVAVSAEDGDTTEGEFRAQLGVAGVVTDGASIDTPARGLPAAAVSTAAVGGGATLLAALGYLLWRRRRRAT